MNLYKGENPNSISQLKSENQISIYPNPANTILNVKCSTQAIVTVFDVTGKLIESKNLKEGYSSVDVSNLNSGMYYVRVMTTAGISNVQAVMVQH